MFIRKEEERAEQAHDEAHQISEAAPARIRDSAHPPSRKATGREVRAGRSRRWKSGAHSPRRPSGYRRNTTKRAMPSPMASPHNNNAPARAESASPRKVRVIESQSRSERNPWNLNCMRSTRSLNGFGSTCRKESSETLPRRRLKDTRKGGEAEEHPQRREQEPLRRIVDKNRAPTPSASTGGGKIAKNRSKNVA